MQHANAILLAHFYDAFSRRDGQAMALCYHHDATFVDPVFALHGDEIGDMWRMLCTNGRDLKLDYGDIVADHHEGSAQWHAYYSFSATGRKVHNAVTSRFEFRNGLILNQIDDFDFWRWSRQALGAPGWLLGWSSMLQNKVQTRALNGLESFQEKNPRPYLSL
jgi:ketosteroid isomerase-like protein